MVCAQYQDFYDITKCGSNVNCDSELAAHNPFTETKFERLKTADLLHLVNVFQVAMTNFNKTSKSTGYLFATPIIDCHLGNASYIELKNKVNGENVTARKVGNRIL